LDFGGLRPSPHKYGRISTFCSPFSFFPNDREELKPRDPDLVGSLVPAVKPSRIDGVWLGTLHATGQDLRFQLTIKSDIAGREFQEAGLL
jgi:hypothetical protein